MLKESKIWGETISILMNNLFEVHSFNAVKDGYCSKHKHEHKYNLFYIDDGKLLIEEWKKNGLIDKTILKSGESKIISPCVYHRFTALENTKAIEIYWVELEKNDIIRQNQGGIKESK